MYDDDALDSALERLSAFGPDLCNGMTSHAPMVAEALASLGRGDAIDPWLDRYAPLLLPRRRSAAPIERAQWRAALGVEARVDDWSAWFAAALREEPWRDVVARWSERLAAGISAAATHGVIRVAHATRALARRDTPLRRDELAQALGLWAASYQPLPTAAGGAVEATDAFTAIARIERVPESRRRFRGTITGALLALDEHAPFAPVIDAFDTTGPDPIADLSGAFARVFLTNANDALGAIVFTHGVTSAAALRALVPLLSPTAERHVLRHAWQAGAALYATFGVAAPYAGEVEAPPDGPDALVARAVAHGEEHAIKGVEACLAEYARTASPVYLAAAERALAMLPR